MGFSKVLLGSEHILNREPDGNGNYRITDQTRLTLDIQGDRADVLEIRAAVRELIRKRLPNYGE